ncbi:multicomponent K+:H+ antiporter subunit E [Pseudomonas duriflava]|uniref:Multicomponent K+:H+ antiporter subunit E n=1 Tax=Pseudomonas duriflava TaxID=459528 RepID=A0A562PV79_9PSED|nr:Na+/H+ antiporter subunit E [Pseudomonas duriflava]TWI48006.1 multicomponent K+:H+ antiporter subunit E [Pseudomonas duriflava]
MKRLFPYPLLSLALTLLWLLLANSLSLGNLLMGGLLGWAIPRVCRGLWFTDVRPRHPLLLAKLLLRVTGDMLWANVQVAALVLGPVRRLNPVFVEVPVDIRQEMGLTLLMSIITLTPGTVSAELSEDGRRVLVHTLDEDDPDALIESIKTRYEKPLMEIFPCSPS